MDSRELRLTKPPPAGMKDITGLGDTVHSLSEAVTILADRLNALALRVALMGGTIDHSSKDSEALLHRLSALVGTAGDEMRHIQHLLQLVESSTRRDLESGRRSWELGQNTNRRSHN
jgi:ABC-type transporter Mla subunit MlaD